jgi:hypothetical protein
MFKKGQKVAKLFSIMGTETVSLQKVARAKKDRVQCENDEHLWYDAKTGREIDPAIPNCFSRLIAMDGE